MAFSVGAISGKIELKDEFSKPMLAVYDSVNKTLTKIGEAPAKVAESVNKMTNSSKAAANTINGLQSRVDKLTERLGRTEIGSKNFRILTDEINKTQRQLEKANGTLKQTDSVLSGLKTGIAAIGVGAFAKSVFDITARFEKYNAVLTNSLRSQTQAAQAMGMIQDFASKTPFAVDELTASYIKFVNRGIKPTQDELTKLGDIAASQGKSFDQLTEAVLDAMTGEFERLKEFGIRASVTGNQVALAFRGMNIEVEKTPEAIQKALIQFGAMEGVAGSMVSVSNTLEGQISNLGDTFDALRVNLGQAFAPAMKVIISTLGTLLRLVSDFIRDNRELVMAIGLAVTAFVSMKTAVSGVQLVMQTLPMIIKSIGTATTLALGPGSLAMAAIAGMIAAYVTLKQRAEEAQANRESAQRAANEAIKVTRALDEQTKAMARQIEEQTRAYRAGLLTNEQMDAYNVKLQVLISRLKDYGVSEAQIRNGLSQSEGAFAGRLTQVIKQSDALEKLNKSARNAATGMRDLNNATEGLNADQEKLNATFDSAPTFATQFSDSMDKIGMAMQKIQQMVSQVVSVVMDNFFQRLQNQMQSIQQKMKIFDTIATVMTRRFEEQLDKEVEDFKKPKTLNLRNSKSGKKLNSNSKKAKPTSV